MSNVSHDVSSHAVSGKKRWEMYLTEHISSDELRMGQKISVDHKMAGIDLIDMMLVFKWSTSSPPCLGRVCDVDI